MPYIIPGATRASQAAHLSREPATPQRTAASHPSFVSHLSMQRSAAVPLTGNTLAVEQTPPAQAGVAGETGEATPQPSSSLPQRAASSADLRAMREQIQNGYTQPYPRSVEVAISKLEKAEAQADQFGVQTPRAKDAWKAGLDVLKSMPVASTVSAEPTTLETPVFDASQYDPGPLPERFASHNEQEAWFRQSSAYNSALAISEALTVLNDSVLAANSGVDYPTPVNIGIALGTAAGVYDYEGTIRPLDQVYQSVQERMTAMQEMLANGQTMRAETLMGDLQHDVRELRRWSHRLMGSSHQTDPSQLPGSIHLT